MKTKSDYKNNYIDFFKSFLKNVKGTHFSIAYDIFQKIMTVPPKDKLGALMAICELYGNVLPEENAKLSESPYLEKLKDLRDRKQACIQRKISFYVDKNYSRCTFYKRCYEYIFNSKSLKDESERIFALYLLIIDSRIPYYSYEVAKTYEMNEERFRDLLNQTEDSRKLIQNYIHRSFPQKTMQAAAILDVMGIHIPPTSDPEAIEKYEQLLVQMSFLIFINK